MTTIRIHAVYLSVIAVLAYLFWAEKKFTQRLSEQVRIFMIHDNLIMTSDVENMKNACEKNINTHYRYAQTYKGKLDSLNSISKETLKNLDNASIELKNNKNISINSLNEAVNNFPKILLNLINDDIVKKSMLKIYGTHKITKPDTINEIKQNNALYLQTLKNQIVRDEIAFYNYVLDQTTPHYSGLTKFLVAIAPKKAAIIEGEKFEADIYLASYSYARDNFIVTIDSDTLLVRDGVAHYKVKPKNIGLRNVKAQISVVNPITGHITTTTGELEYHVLPKCSLDCNIKTQ